MIAHQWRQPLNAISVTINTLQFKINLEGMDKEMLMHELNEISHFAQHLSGTIDDFRYFARTDRAASSTTVYELIDKSVKIVESAVTEKGIWLQKAYHDNHQVLKTYPREIHQIILTLIKNAEDAHLEKRIPQPIITITSDSSDPLRIAVSDNAGGVPEEIIEHIFDPYFSTKKAKEGTGLGLYMAKMILEKHSLGEISVHNDDAGAVFVLQLRDLDEDT
jgi:signal transduction histidine kinase